MSRWLAYALLPTGLMHPLPFGSKLCLLLSLLVLVPRAGLAAELLPVSSGLPGTAAPAPLRLSEEPLATPPARSRPPTVLRVLAEAGLGLAIGTGLGGAGVVVGNKLCVEGLVGSPGGFIPCFTEVTGGAFVGGSLGIPLGVFLGGELAGGDGRLYAPFLGMASGIAASALVGIALGNIYYAALVVMPFVLGGSLLGYELSERGGPAPQTPGAPAVASASPRLQPVLAFSSRGALFGLGGSF